MKKTAAAVVAAALIITLSGATVFARNCSRQTDVPGAVAASVADSVANAVTGLKNIVYNQCDYCNAGGHCYIDADGDGICDHRVSDPVNDCPNYDGSPRYNKNCAATGRSSGSCCNGNSGSRCRQGHR